MNRKGIKIEIERYTTHYASLHLAAIEQLGFAAVLWEFFRAPLHGALNRFRHSLGKETLEAITSAIDATEEEFLFRALQIDLLWA